MPNHIKRYVEKEINDIIQFGHLEKIQKVGENYFVSPLAITVKKSQISQKRIGFRGKLKDSCVKLRPQMPNMEKLLNQISTEITRVQEEPL